MTAPLPDAVGVVERLAEYQAFCRSVSRDTSVSILSEAIQTIQSQAARIAELEADKRAMQSRLDRWEPKPVDVSQIFTGGPK